MEKSPTTYSKHWRRKYEYESTSMKVRVWKYEYERFCRQKQATNTLLLLLLSIDIYSCEQLCFLVPLPNVFIQKCKKALLCRLCMVDGSSWKITVCMYRQHSTSFHKMEKECMALNQCGGSGRMNTDPDPTFYVYTYPDPNIT